MKQCFTDAHVHLASYEPGDLEDVVGRATEAGVILMVTAGTTVESSLKSIDLANRYPSIKAAVGIHPLDLTEPIDEMTINALRQMAEGNPEVVAVSEIGLDFQDHAPPKNLQNHAFRQQIRLAKTLKLPIIFHSRDAYPATLKLLEQEAAGSTGGAVHYFEGDIATACKFVKLGFYISFGRPLLRFPHLEEAARRIPIDRILLETDAFPQPWKKRRKDWTEPRHVIKVAERLAELRGLTLEDVAYTTNHNLKTMLRLM